MRALFICIMGLVFSAYAQQADTTRDQKLMDLTSIQDVESLEHREARQTDTLKTLGLDMSVDRKITQNAFREGEHLVFDVVYGPVHAGTATMSIPGIKSINGRPCYRIRTTAESNRFFSGFYKVRDAVECFVDVEGIFPWYFEKHIREGRYRSDKVVEFDQINHRAIENKKDTLNVPPYIQDVLSSFYFIRTRDLKVGKSFDIDNYGDNKIYPLKVLVHKKERIKVPAGRFNCIVVEPVMRVEGIFKHQGRLLIWLTDDERKIPVLMKSKILVGSIDVELKSMSLPKQNPVR